MQCNLCRKETTNPRFCSKSCAAKFNNKKFPKRKLAKICTKCENLVKSHRHTLCSIHFEEYRERFKNDKTLKEYREKASVSGKHPSWINAHVRGFARSWLKHLTDRPCAKCGYELHVELAHIKGLSEFDENTLLSEVNSENNVIQLCPNCHWEFDNLPRDGIFTKLLKDLNKISPGSLQASYP